MALILLRHTTPRVSPGTCYGRTDLDVADSFEAEAETALAALPRFDRIISSPLVRCHKLAGFISEQAGLPVIRDPGYKKWTLEPGRACLGQRLNAPK
jgi:alpha-ribazole phosphatase